MYTPLLQTVLFFNQFKNNIFKYFNRLYMCASYFISPRVFIFFEEYSMPFPVFSLILDRNLMATPTLVYNADDSIFFPYILIKSFSEFPLDNKINKIPILSMEIIDGQERCVKDLTDFVENLRYIDVPNMEKPTISNIVSVWCIINSTPLNRERFSVRYITINGNEMNVSLLDMTPLEDDILDPVNRSPPSPNSE